MIGAALLVMGAGQLYGQVATSFMIKLPTKSHFSTHEGVYFVHQAVPSQTTGFEVTVSQNGSIVGHYLVTKTWNTSSPTGDPWSDDWDYVMANITLPQAGYYDVMIHTPDQVCLNPIPLLPQGYGANLKYSAANQMHTNWTSIIDMSYWSHNWDSWTQW